MSTDRGTPETDTLIAEAVASALLGLRVAGIGIVKSYDNATKTATVQPAVRRPVQTEDGDLEQETDSPMQNVIVAQWGGGALSANVLLAAGDAVLLVYLDYSPALWRKRGDVSDTPDTHAHRYAIALPLHRPRGGAASEEGNSFGVPDGTRVHFEGAVARVGPATDPAAAFVALATKVDTELSALKAILGSLATALGGNPAIETAAAAAGTGLTAALGAWPSGSTAASKLKSG